MRPSADVLTGLFENAPRFVERLLAEDVASYGELIDRAERLAAELPEDEQIELIDGHPRIGADPWSVSTQSYREQGYHRVASEGDEGLARRLDHLNAEYEGHFGFRFCIFVDGRPRYQVADIMESRLGAGREDELQRGLSDVFAIARNRLGKLTQPLEEAR
ncbi:MAG: 2-oxo-4-hydroxy-4-carboxy-5-ureidoimidazoline decarboxylase [Candidatus Limnocylindrales bacterium]